MYSTVYELNSRTLWKAYLLDSTDGKELLIMFMIAVGCAIFALSRRRPLFLIPVLPLTLFGVFWIRMLAGEMQWGQTLLNQYTGRKCLMTEGITHVQAQQRREGHSLDRVIVGGVPLEISHFEIGPHYRDSIAYGGVLKEGVEARVWYCPGASTVTGGAGPIVRVDVKRGA